MGSKLILYFFKNAKTNIFRVYNVIMFFGPAEIKTQTEKENLCREK